MKANPFVRPTQTSSIKALYNNLRNLESMVAHHLHSPPAPLQCLGAVKLVTGRYLTYTLKCLPLLQTASPGQKTMLVTSQKMNQILLYLYLSRGQREVIIPAHPKINTIQRYFLQKRLASRTCAIITMLDGYLPPQKAYFLPCRKRKSWNSPRRPTLLKSLTCTSPTIIRR